MVSRGALNRIRTHPPQPSSVPVSRNRPARAFLLAPGFNGGAGGSPLGEGFTPRSQWRRPRGSEAAVEGPRSWRRKLCAGDRLHLSVEPADGERRTRELVPGATPVGDDVNE